MCNEGCRLKLLIKFLICAYCFYLAWKFAWLNCNEQFIAFLVVGFAFVFILFAKELTPFFENISIFGLNIKLRKVETLVQDLTNLLVAVAGLEYNKLVLPIIGDLKPDVNTILNKADKISELLKSYDVSNQIVTDIQAKYFHSQIHLIYTKILLNSFTKEKAFNNEVWIPWTKTHNIITSKEFKNLKNSYEINNGDMTNFNLILSDYEYYEENRKFKDIKRFENCIFLPPINYHPNNKE